MSDSPAGALHADHPEQPAAFGLGEAGYMEGEGQMV